MTPASSSGVPRRYMLVAFALALLAGSLWSLLRPPPPPEPPADTSLYARLGGQAAEKTLTFVERGGSVLVIEPRLHGHAAPAMEAMIRAYETALRNAGVSIAARERVMLPGPANEAREEPWTLSAMRERYPGASAIASFAGPPVQPVARGERPPMLVFCAEPVDARALLRRGEAEVVIAPRPPEETAPGEAIDAYAMYTVGDPL